MTATINAPQFPADRMDTPFIVNYGGGVDSTAMLIGMVRHGLRPDYILFADTGSEKPQTYVYINMFNTWLEDQGFPEVTVVCRKKSRPSKTGPGYRTIEGNCLQNKTLPSLAFGRKSCSLKWKAEPMDRWLKQRPDIQRAWKREIKPVKAIGYDNGPKDSRRAVNRTEDKWYRYWYPLRDEAWGWDRTACCGVIVDAGLPVPVKSACFFCPASKPWEVLWLAADNPELLAKALRLEDGAQPNLLKIDGLWRKATKTRSGSWRGYCEAEGIVAPGGYEVLRDPDELMAAAQALMPDTAGTEQLKPCEIF